ncbi:hypothetical protein HMPREF1872_00772 [Amygdalobacter nucleatus]|uniref:Uncharacterized protein n=1 Tax=Amygdalobacter nucleatus TaxID=3029274 RepID=A0A133YCQ9_9FIRM|nr:hypothetical protein HMPREF1872_00772 [Amygdalobacter nucleatus]
MVQTTTLILFNLKVLVRIMKINKDLKDLIVAIFKLPIDQSLWV